MRPFIRYLAFSTFRPDLTTKHLGVAADHSLQVRVLCLALALSQSLVHSFSTRGLHWRNFPSSPYSSEISSAGLSFHLYTVLSWSCIQKCICSRVNISSRCVLGTQGVPSVFYREYAALSVHSASLLTAMPLPCISFRWQNTMERE